MYKKNKWFCGDVTVHWLRFDQCYYNALTLACFANTPGNLTWNNQLLFDQSFLENGQCSNTKCAFLSLQNENNGHKSVMRGYTVTRTGPWSVVNTHIGARRTKCTLASLNKWLCFMAVNLVHQNCLFSLRIVKSHTLVRSPMLMGSSYPETTLFFTVEETCPAWINPGTAGSNSASTCNLDYFASLIFPR